MQELNRPGQQCRVVRTWTQADGSQAYQVQALDSGEMMTIVESGPLAMPAAPGRTRVRSVSTTIFHWGRSRRPPAGSPLPPGAVVEKAQTPGARRIQSGNRAVSRPLPAGTRVVEPKRPLLSRLMPWRKPAPPEMGVGPLRAGTGLRDDRSKAGAGRHARHPAVAASKQSPGGGRAETAAARPHPRRQGQAAAEQRDGCDWPRTGHANGREDGAGSHCRGAPAGRSLAARLQQSSARLQWSPPYFAARRGSEETAAPATHRGGHGQGRGEAEPAPAHLGKPRPKPGTPHRPAPQAVAKKKTDDKLRVAAREKEKSTVVKVAVELPKPTDPHESWGKVEPLEPPPSVKKAMEKAVADSKRPKPTPKEETNVAPTVSLPEVPLPRSLKPQDDPLLNPSPYRKHTPEELPKPEPKKEPKPEPKKETIVSTHVAASRVEPPQPSARPHQGRKTRPRSRPTRRPSRKRLRGRGRCWPPGAALPAGADRDSAAAAAGHAALGAAARPGAPGAAAEPHGQRSLPGRRTGQHEQCLHNAGADPTDPVRAGGRTDGQCLLVPRAVGAAPGLSAGTAAAQPGAAQPPAAAQAGAGGGLSGAAAGLWRWSAARAAAAGRLPMAPVTGVARIPVMPQYVPAAYYATPNMTGAMPGAMTAAGYPPAQPAPSAAATTTQAMQMLRDSDFPSQREWAAEQLSDLNWRTNPQVVQVLLTAARSDPAPMVRACCVRSLMKMQVNTVPAVSTIQALKSDADPRVRDAVAEAMISFGVGPGPGTASIQPVGVPPAPGTR